MASPLPMLLAACLLAAAPMAAAEDVYKWVDADGQIHFGSRPPAGARATRMAPSSTEPAPATPNANWQQQLGQSNMRRLQKQQSEEQDARKQQQMARRCQSAQESLDILTRGGAVYQVNSRGEREYLGDEQRQAAIASAHQRVAAYCR